MLKCDSLNFNFHHKALLKNLSFTLQKGENLTIIGENGAGKSTLAKLLCALIPSYETIMIEDKYIETLSATKRASLINYMPSKFSLYDPYITVKEYLNLSLYKQSPKEQTLLEVLSLLGLSKHKDAYANSLSSGEQQLLMLASTLIQNAQITIFDEPTSNLDPKKSKLVFDILKHSPHLKQKIVITHNLQFAYKLGFSILYLDEGKAQYFKEGFFSPENLKKHFADTIMIVDAHIVEVL